MGRFILFIYFLNSVVDLMKSNGYLGVPTAKIRRYITGSHTVIEEFNTWFISQCCISQLLWECNTQRRVLL